MRDPLHIFAVGVGRAEGDSALTNTTLARAGGVARVGIVGTEAGVLVVLESERQSALLAVVTRILEIIAKHLREVGFPVRII